MILAFCDKSYIVQIMLLVKMFFKLVCYIAPPIIIIVSIIGFVKPITTGEQDDFKNSRDLLIKRIIAGLVILFLPTIISYVFNNLINGEKVEFIACMESATAEKVEQLKTKEEQEEKAANKAKEKEDEETLRKAYEAEQKQNSSRKQTFEEWKKEKEEKERQQQQQQSGGNYNNAPGTAGTTSTVSTSKPGVSVKSFNTSSGSMKYWEITPTSVKENLPLIIFLHGSGETGSVDGVGSMPIVSYVANQWDRNNRPFIFLAPVAPSHDWTSKTDLVKGLIDNAVSEYKVDTSHIIITGMSMGGYGTWSMVAKYGTFFSAAVPMSGCSSGYNGSSFVGVPIYAIVGSQETDIVNCMSNLVNSINNSGGKAILDVKQGATHSTIQPYYRDENLFNWMLSQ